MHFDSMVKERKNKDYSKHPLTVYILQMVLRLRIWKFISSKSTAQRNCPYNLG